MICKKYFFGTLLTPVFVFLSFMPVKSAVLKGFVKDSVSKETLVGATVYRKDSMQVYSVAGLDGSYSLKKLTPGTYIIVAQFFGYVTQERKVTITDNNQTVTLNFDMVPQQMKLNQVHIVGNYDKGSDNYARSEEKNSDYIMNVVSAKAIQLSPDITIGDVLQRISGVVTEKSVTGGGKYATIRGMDKRYNYTSVNGVLIPSPDYKNRFVPLDLFPADIVERIEVIKTLTSDMEGGAIGGATNIVLKDAPDAFVLNAHLATGYCQTLFDKKYNQFDVGAVNPKSPNEIHGADYGAKVTDFPTSDITYTPVNVLPDVYSGFTIGDRFLNGKLGVLASASYQNSFSAAQGFFLKPQAQPLPGPYPNTPEWDYMQSFYYSTQQRRGAAHVKLDYVVNPKNKISFYTLYAEMDQMRSRFRQDSSGTLVGGELNPNYESKVVYEHIYNATLQGKDSLAHNLLLDWTGAYSRAWGNQPDWSEIKLLGTIGLPVTIFSSLTRRWANVTDQDFSGYVNLTYKFQLFGQNIELKAGAMNRDKSRNAFYAEYNFYATPVQQPYTTIDAILSNPKYYSFADTTGSPQNGNTYAIQENVMAYYGMGKIMIGPKIQVVGGLRMESTNQAYQTQLPIVDVGASGTKQYTDMLPSIEVKYLINKKQAIHASYFASIARPGFFEIVPYSFAGDYYTEVGNPKLLHTQANNYDLRYEFFPKSSEQILAGVFYKQIYNPIEIAVERGSGPSSTLVEPINLGSDSNPAINYGFEFVFTKYIKHFGISANYTYTHSRITVPEQIYRNTVGTGQPKTFDTTETRPLQGQVDHIANLSLIYKEPKLGLNAQVSAVYTGKSIADISLFYGLDIWQMPMVKIDFSFEKRLSKKVNLTLYGKANNLLNTPLILRMFPPTPYKNIPGNSSPGWLSNQDVSNGSLNNGIIIERELYGQSYLLGVRYKF